MWWDDVQNFVLAYDWFRLNVGVYCGTSTKVSEMYVLCTKSLHSNRLHSNFGDLFNIQLQIFKVIRLCLKVVSLFSSIFWTFSHHTLSCSSIFDINLNKIFWRVRCLFHKVTLSFVKISAINRKPEIKSWHQFQLSADWPVPAALLHTHLLLLHAQEKHIFQMCKQ